jgi:hypothetical protein
MKRVPLDYITEPGWWLMSVSPAAWEAEIRRITALGQTKLKVRETHLNAQTRYGETYLSFQVSRKHT